MCWTRRLFRLTCLAVALSLAACHKSMPPRLIDGVNTVTLREGVRDAHAQRINRYPCLRADAALASRLNAALQSDDIDEARAHGLAFLDGAHQLALKTSHAELSRLSSDGWHDLAHTYFGASMQPDDEAMRVRIGEAFDQRTDHQHWFLRRQVQHAKTAADVHAVLKPLKRGMEKPIAHVGRLARALPLALFTLPSALTVASIHAHEWHGELDAPFERAIRFTPLVATEATDDDARLLQQYAPIIVQEKPVAPSYGPDVDRFGRVNARDDAALTIEVDRPTVYAYARRIWLHDREHMQLTYTHWYPQHPQLKSFDPEAGKVEGVTLRITLNAQQKPALFETLYNCGCYHRVYPVASLEQHAQAEWGEPQKGKQFAIERKRFGRIDLIVPKVVRDPAKSERPIIRCRAGWHAIADVAFDESRHVGEVVRDKEYALQPYDELEQLPSPDGGVVSMFYANGLVRGAQRLEGLFFAPLGMLSAGQPRQRGTQLIHWDQYDFDDPTLLARTLRLPEQF